MSKELRQMMDEERETGRKEGMKEGRKEGIKEGMMESFILMVKKGLVELADAAKELGMTKKEFNKLAGLY